MLPQQSLCKVVREVPDNIAQEKPLYNVALIFFSQNCTGKNPRQCRPRGCRQQCTRKILCNVVLILLRQQFALKKTLCNVVREVPDDIVYEKIMCNVV